MVRSSVAYLSSDTETSRILEDSKLKILPMTLIVSRNLSNQLPLMVEPTSLKTLKVVLSSVYSKIGPKKLPSDVFSLQMHHLTVDF